jgi:hypothetical protein
MSSTPSINGSTGRTSAGRFAAGNNGGPGNPHARRVARLRAALLRAVTPEDLTAVVTALLTQAKAGDVQAAKELLQRLLGPPVAEDIVERLRVLEETMVGYEQRVPR